MEKKQQTKADYSTGFKGLSLVSWPMYNEDYSSHAEVM